MDIKKAPAAESTWDRRVTLGSSQTENSKQFLPCEPLPGIRPEPVPIDAVRWTLTDTGWHRESLQLDLCPFRKVLVCVSGTNRQNIWHCHLNREARMDAANEGLLGRVHPGLSITAVIIYQLRLLRIHTYKWFFLKMKWMLQMLGLGFHNWNWSRSCDFDWQPHPLQNATVFPTAPSFVDCYIRLQGRPRTPFWEPLLTDQLWDLFFKKQLFITDDSLI